MLEVKLLLGLLRKRLFFRLRSVGFRAGRQDMRRMACVTRVEWPIANRALTHRNVTAVFSLSHQASATFSGEPFGRSCKASLSKPHISAPSVTLEPLLSDAN